MKTLIALMLAISLAGMTAWLVANQRELADLRANNEVLQRQIAAAPPSAPASAQPSSGAAALTTDEQIELLRLRGQVVPLRRQVNELSNRVAAAVRLAESQGQATQQLKSK
jgi:hypothetical protein